MEFLLTDREQSILDCMIANLFEEYKFFSKYPERQLKIAAILFGKPVLEIRVFLQLFTVNFFGCILYSTSFILMFAFCYWTVLR